MSRKKARTPDGELRRSQMITTFGPGSMVDLPERSVLIGGLEYWRGHMREIREDRLAERVAEELGVSTIELREPPSYDREAVGEAAFAGVSAFVFPTWFVAQVDETHRTRAGKDVRTRPLVPWNRLVKGGYLNDRRKVVSVVPMRFVQACPRGHISDIDWYAFVRRDFDTKRVGQLWLDEGGAGNDFAEIFVRCEMTGQRRPLADAKVPNAKTLGRCPGRQPWLGPDAWEVCDAPNKLLVRSASNAYFARTLSVISIPDSDEDLREAVTRVWDFLEAAEGPSEIRYERKKKKVSQTLEGYTDEAVWAEIMRRRGGPRPTDAGGDKSIKQLEIETLRAQPEGMGEDQPHGEFYARTRPSERIPAWIRGKLERVVLVHRLREVMAQVGFTRFEASVSNLEGELDELSIGVQSAPLSGDPSWVPAIENRGEGVFIGFSAHAMEAWWQRSGVLARSQALQEGFDAWASRRQLAHAVFPGVPYLMLHSLSHLLITAVALECGYTASAIRERIYAGKSGYGILLYTGSPGSEGTLGGLVDVGRSIEHHLLRALQLGRLCSSDPVCAQHEPAHVQEERYLHGAACHGCLLIAETSCERRNQMLDRALVVPTVSTPDAAFFGEAFGRGHR